MKKANRVVYILLTIILFLAEIFIALFAHDKIIRPYVGDVLVTILLCSLIRVFIPNKVRFLTFYIFIFATIVEVGQYFDYIELLGLGNVEFFAILMGNSFSFIDIVCYAVGCAIFYGIERILTQKTFFSRRL